MLCCEVCPATDVHSVASLRDTGSKLRGRIFVVFIMLPGRLISRFGHITWRDRSPDHAVPNYFLWGHVIRKVYETRPANIADLHQQILECIQGIPKDTLQSVMTTFPSRLQECIVRHGDHKQCVILKQQ